MDDGSETRIDKLYRIIEQSRGRLPEKAPLELIYKIIDLPHTLVQEEPAFWKLQNRLVDVALYTLDRRAGMVKVDLATLSDPNETALAFLARHASALAPDAAAGIAAELVLALELAPETLASDLDTDFQNDAGATAIGLAALTPEFLFR